MVGGSMASLLAMANVCVRAEWGWNSVLSKANLHANALGLSVTRGDRKAKTTT